MAAPAPSTASFTADDARADIRDIAIQLAQMAAELGDEHMVEALPEAAHDPSPPSSSTCCEP